MKSPYSLDQALVIGKALTKTYDQWGQHADYPYYPWQFVQIIHTLMEHMNLDGVSEQEHRHVKQQLAAALAREAKLKNRSNNVSEG